MSFKETLQCRVRDAAVFIPTACSRPPSAGSSCAGRGAASRDRGKRASPAPADAAPAATSLAACASDEAATAGGGRLSAAAGRIPVQPPSWPPRGAHADLRAQGAVVAALQASQRVGRCVSEPRSMFEASPWLAGPKEARVACHVLCVTCCMSCVMCHVLCVVCCVSHGGPSGSMLPATQGVATWVLGVARVHAAWLDLALGTLLGGRALPAHVTVREVDV